MFNKLFRQCKENYYNRKETCCHQKEQSQCDCSPCLHSQFFSDGSDYYECKNKLNCYVLNYGASYISEIYCYLQTSDILNKFSNTINILSLGCGFAPDYFAFDKFIKDKDLNLKFNYYGIDNSEVWKYISWKELNLSTDNPAKFCKEDLTENIDLEFNKYDIIFLSKIYSTIRRNNANTTNFLNNIVRNIQNMNLNSVLVFNDINSKYVGRDDFDGRISNCFKSQNIKRFYTDTPPHRDPSWEKINDIIIYNNLTSQYDSDIKQTIFFEYWKKQ